MRREGLRKWMCVAAAAAGVAVAAAVGAVADGKGSSHRSVLAPMSATAGPYRATGPSSGSDGQPSSNPPEAVHQDRSPPLRTIPPAPPQPGPREHDQRVVPGPAPSSTADPVVQTRGGKRAAAVVGASFAGLGDGFSGPSGTMSVNSAPPDDNGAVGPNHYVQIVNTSLAVFNKAGAVLYGPVPSNTVWSGFGGGCQANNDGDATVAYDRLANRWVISQFSVSTTPFLMCVAVSTTADPTGSYNRYSFQYSSFPDYPKLGVWGDAYYTTLVLFGSSYQGPEVCAYDRAKMLVGQAATQKCFTLGTSYGPLLPADVDGPTPPPAGSPNYLLEVGTGVLHLWKFHVDWTTPANSTLTGPTTLPVAAFSPACAGSCIPQPGTTRKLDALGDRLMYRLAYRNFGDHESLVTSHSVVAGGSVGVRWYELRSPGGGAAIFQQGTYAPDSTYRWMGSVAMDASGGIGLGYSVSSSSLQPGIRYTGRLAGDAPGVMTQGEGVLFAGSGSQTGLSRWGDYSSMSIDPSDNCTFWYTNEYLPANGSFNWRTRIGSFKLPGCGGPVTSGFSIAANPTSLSVAKGASGTDTISTAVTSGSPQTVSLNASGQPAGTTVSFSPTSVTAGNSSTMTVNVGSTTTQGTYTITVTGTGTASTAQADVTLTVPGPAGAGIVNGGFEAGSLSGWTASGAYLPRVVTTKRSGSYGAALGSASPVNGDSTLAQTVTVPSGSPRLIFWYQPHCTDSIRYDQIQLQVRSTGGATLATVLNVCSNSGSWTKVSYNLSSFAGQTVVLWFNDHDDGYAGDPTYFVLDDVSVG